MHILEPLFDLIAPHNCLVCNQEGSLLCAWCRPEVLTSVESTCLGCGTLVKDFSVCKVCQPKLLLNYAWHTSIYEKAAKDLVQALKFQQKRSAANIMADHMNDTLPFFEDILIIPIPTAAIRVRQRGFDHTLLIAKRLANRRGLPFLNVLARSGSSRQVGQNKQKRIKQLNGKFRVKSPNAIKGQNILIIDDVSTSGATLAEVARTLKRNGAKSVNAAVFAVSRF